MYNTNNNIYKHVHYKQYNIQTCTIQTIQYTNMYNTNNKIYKHVQYKQ